MKAQLRIAVLLVGLALIVSRVGLANDSLAETRHDPVTGLVMAEGVDSVRVRCTGCHSVKLIMQNRATKEGWTEIIRWMQRTQKLGPLGEDENAVIAYLAKHYGPRSRAHFRRRSLPQHLRPPPVPDSGPVGATP